MTGMNNVLTAGDATILQTSWQSLIDMVVDVVYSIFQFFLDLLIANTALVVAIVIVGILYAVVRRWKSKVM